MQSGINWLNFAEYQLFGVVPTQIINPDVLYIGHKALTSLDSENIPVCINKMNGSLI